MSDSRLLNWLRGLARSNASYEREIEVLKAERNQYKANSDIHKERVKNLLLENAEMAEKIEKLETFRDEIKDIQVNYEKEMATQGKKSKREAIRSTPTEASTQGPEPAKNPKPHIRE